MATPRRLDDAPLDKRIRGAQVGCAVGALVAFPFLPAGLEPMSLAVPVGLVTGFWLAPAVHANGPLPGGTVGVMSVTAVLLGDALVVLTAGGEPGAMPMVFTLGLAFFGLPALVPASIAAVAWAFGFRWLERRLVEPQPADQQATAFRPR